MKYARYISAAIYDQQNEEKKTLYYFPRPQNSFIMRDKFVCRFCGLIANPARGYLGIQSYKAAGLFIL
jgi:hypothetical protein